MQNSEDDMNELFRRASRGFRLNLQGEDWDAIQKRLASNAPVSTALETKIKDRNNYKLLIIALFVYAISGTIVYTVLNIRNRPSGKPEEKINKVTHFSQGRSKSQSKSKFTVSSSATLVGIPPENEKKNDPAYFWIQDYQVASNLPDPGELEIHHSDQINSAPIQIKISSKPGTSNKKDRDIDKSKRFYIGLIAGPQFNNTKEQEFSKPGVSAGLLAGYRLNSKLGIETGFFISDKRYHSAGEYFSMSKISATMPAGMKVLSVESKSTVLEIPLRIKYNWLKTSRGDVFGTAGLSSYILTKESNRYLASLNGSQEDLSGSYSQSQKYFAAAVNLSAGYQFRTGRGMTLRVEPYLQIPVKKIGVGSLPILSTGVYLGITLPLSK